MINEKIETILKLADLGFSRVEIEKLMAENAEKPAENAEKTPKKEGLIDLLATEKPEKTEEKAEKEPTEQPTPSVPTHGEGAKNGKNPLEEKLEGIEATLKAIQAQNVRWSNMPDSAAKPKTELEIVQEILGGINHGNE